ncbi:hypothetical protein BHE74_00047512, partial [Ensete ventricosum]
IIPSVRVKRGGSDSSRKKEEGEKVMEEEKGGLGRTPVTIGGEVERVDGRALRYEEFVERYLMPNRPVLLTGLMDDWRAATDWLAPDGRAPNLPFFAAHFGDSVVQVKPSSLVHACLPL